MSEPVEGCHFVPCATSADFRFKVYVDGTIWLDSCREHVADLTDGLVVVDVCRIPEPVGESVRQEIETAIHPHTCQEDCNGEQGWFAAPCCGMNAVDAVLPVITRLLEAQRCTCSPGGHVVPMLVVNPSCPQHSQQEGRQ